MADLGFIKVTDNYEIVDEDFEDLVDAAENYWDELIICLGGLTRFRQLMMVNTEENFDLFLLVLMNSMVNGLSRSLCLSESETEGFIEKMRNMLINYKETGEWGF